MAARGVSVEFNSQAPTLEAFLAHAERFCDLPLEILPLATERSQVSFPAFPGRFVEVRRIGETRLALSTLNAPTLYQLLWQVANNLDGSPRLPQSLSVPHPLTADFVRRNDKADTLRGAGVLAGLGLAGIAVLGGLSWLLLR